MKPLRWQCCGRVGRNASLVLLIMSLSCNDAMDWNNSDLNGVPSSERLRQMCIKDSIQRYEAVRHSNGRRPVDIVFAASTHQALYFAPGEGGLFVWDSTRCDWQPCIKGMRDGSRIVNDIVEHRGKKIVFVATDDGVYRRGFGDESWVRFSSGLPFEDEGSLSPIVSELEIAERHGMVLARVPVNGYGIYAAAIDSSTWHPIGNGLPDATLVGEIAFDNESEIIYAASAMKFLPVLSANPFHRGLFAGKIKADNRVEWSEIPRMIPGVPHPRIHMLKANPHTKGVNVCTPQGLYQYDGVAWELVRKEYFAEKVFFESEGTGRTILLSTDSLHVMEHERWTTMRKLPWHKYAFIAHIAFLHGDVYASTNDGVFVLKRGKEGFEAILKP